MRLNQFSIAKRFFASLLLPFIFIFAIGSHEISEFYGKYVQMSAVVETGVELDALGKLVHWLQVERGTSSGFLGSGGKKMQDKMLGAREKVDAALASFLVQERKLAETTEADLHRYIDMSSEALARLAEVRKEVSALSTPRETAFDYYNATIDSLMRLMSAMSKSERGSTLPDRLAAYNNLVLAKDLAGRERGEGAGIIASGSLSERGFERFRQLSGGFVAHIERFIALEPASAEAGLRQRLDDAGLQQALTMSARILRDGVGGDLTGLDAGEWFALTTGVIDEMARIETETLQTIQALAAASSTEKWNSFVLLSVLVAGTALLVILGSVVIARSVTRPLNALIACMRRLAEGRVDMSGVDTSGEDEVAQMARAVSTFATVTEENARRKLEEDRQHLEEREAQQRQIEAERRESAEQMERVIAEIGNALKRLSEGDVAFRIAAELPGAYDALRKDYNESVRMLEATILAVKAVADSVERGVSELRVASDDLARRTEQQAAVLETTAASMAEVSTTVTSTAKRATAAGTYVAEVSDFTRSSGQLVEESVSVIGKIADSSKEISQIVSVIDEIAFQTNLLALNAGVEAARAGEAGKGFAVVAQEVRDLAQRSSNAANEIRGLIDRSVTSLESGVSLFERTGGALGTILEKVETIRTEVSAIVDASREQADSVSHVNDTLSQMDTTTQQNAALVEQATAATHGLAGEATALAGQIAAFKVEQRQPAKLARAA
ncbi:methyl-accepting chemotaxis protein [Jiella endophytica]|uniref:Methyl-accepting chemotaxis protein n=1 Tax=Jiella endophytica TaxID=2558362 RepID=A0A4Y8RD25_9HYPH|nr:methyl-accepting chemotaxis protein [Jiella endophytica]TFF19935.1 methyl-accepting chemotaxis protein [Jiella endophytica]